MDVAKNGTPQYRARTAREPGTGAEVLAAYRERFGVVLDRVPAVACRRLTAAAGYRWVGSGP